MDAQNSGLGPRPGLSALQAAAHLDSLAAYVGVCPTCLAWDDPEDAAAASAEREPMADRSVCPTCERSSVEWDLAVAIDDQLREMRGLERLDRELRSPGMPEA